MYVKCGKSKINTSENVNSPKAITRLHIIFLQSYQILNQPLSTQKKTQYPNHSDRKRMWAKRIDRFFNVGFNESFCHKKLLPIYVCLPFYHYESKRIQKMVSSTSHKVTILQDIFQDTISFSGNPKHETLSDYISFGVSFIISTVLKTGENTLFYN